MELGKSAKISQSKYRVLRGAKPLFLVPFPLSFLRRGGIRGRGYWKKLANRARIVLNR
jgi:hypothetical protein